MPLYVPAQASLVNNIIKWYIVDRTGVVHDLTWQTSSEVFVPKGTKGLGTAKTELVLDKLPFAPGSILRYIKTQPLEINLPLVIHKPNILEAMIAAEQVRNWFYTGNERNKTPAYLRVTRPQDNTDRQIAVYYQGGLEGDLDEGSPVYIPYVISLIAPLPYWTDVEPIELSYDNTYLGDIITINNPGDFDGYPIITIGGPITNLVIANLTTGKQLSLTNNGGLTISASDFVSIDTRPAFIRNVLPITNQDGTSLYSYLSNDSSVELWLQPGANQIRVSGTGGTSSTTISINYTPQYNGVLR